MSFHPPNLFFWQSFSMLSGKAGLTISHHARTLLGEGARGGSVEQFSTLRHFIGQKAERPRWATIKHAFASCSVSLLFTSIALQYSCKRVAFNVSQNNVICCRSWAISAQQRCVLGQHWKRGQANCGLRGGYSSAAPDACQPARPVPGAGPAIILCFRLPLHTLCNQEGPARAPSAIPGVAPQRHQPLVVQPTFEVQSCPARTDTPSLQSPPAGCAQPC